MEVLWQLKQLAKLIHGNNPYVQERIPFSLDTTVHLYLPGDLAHKELEAADIVRYLERAIHNCINLSHCS